MTESIIRGEFEYNKKSYPFVIQNRILTVVQSAFHYIEDFKDKKDLGILFGVTDTNKYIFLLDCQVLNSQFFVLNGKIQISLHGYVLQDNKDDTYDRIKFHSPALNVFYSPQKAWTPQIGENQGQPGLTINPYRDSSQKIVVNILDETIKCTLDFECRFNLRLEDCQALSISTNFSMVFQNPKSSTDVGKYYLYIRDFLAFANFRRNIPFDQITLWQLGKDGKFYESGEVVIFQKDDISYDLKTLNTITYDDLGDNLFAKLFKDIAEQRISKNYNPYFIPPNSTEYNVVDREKWLVAAIAFEGEFNKKYKDLKSEQSSDFRDAKSLLLSAITQAVNTSGVSINNPKNKYLKSFQHLIEHYDTTIKEKYQSCETHFSLEIENIKKNYCYRLKIPNDVDFAEEYAKARNRSAHGVIEPIKNTDLVTFLLLRCFIYLLTMERASIPSEKRKKIITKLFG